MIHRSSILRIFINKVMEPSQNQMTIHHYVCRSIDGPSLSLMAPHLVRLPLFSLNILSFSSAITPTVRRLYWQFESAQFFICFLSMPPEHISHKTENKTYLIHYQKGFRHTQILSEIHQQCFEIATHQVPLTMVWFVMNFVSDRRFNNLDVKKLVQQSLVKRYVDTFTFLKEVVGLYEIFQFNLSLFMI